MNTFDLISDLKIGHIVEVSGTTIRVELWPRNFSSVKVSKAEFGGGVWLVV
jgi:hypothetical protein